MRKRRRFVSEINLTPLLDVLFSILFIVMLAGTAGEQGLQKEYLDQVDRNNQLEQDLKLAKDELDSYRLFESEAIILTVINDKDANNHFLSFYQGTEKTEIDKITLGLDRTENTKARIESLITELIDNTDNQPVYIVFYLDNSKIYTEEYKTVYNILNELQEKHKEVFFKVMREDE